MFHCTPKTFICRFFYRHCIKFSIFFNFCSMVLLVKWQVIYFLTTVYVAFNHWIFSHWYFQNSNS